MQLKVEFINDRLSYLIIHGWWWVNILYPHCKVLKIISRNYHNITREFRNNYLSMIEFTCKCVLICALSFPFCANLLGQRWQEWGFGFSMNNWLLWSFSCSRRLDLLPNSWPHCNPHTHLFSKCIPCNFLYHTHYFNLLWLLIYCCRANHIAWRQKRFLLAFH